MLNVMDTRIEFLHSARGTPSSESQFLIDATMTVIEMRQVLKWMHVYEYFKHDDVVFGYLKDLFLF